MPDDELVLIFHDLYLVNAYASQSSSRVDTLNIYEPVFARYGYTSEDIRHTIGSFARRKSASLSNDIVQPAMEMLRVESEGYSHRLAMVDTVAEIAKRRFAREVLSRRSIVVRRVADTARLRFTIPAEAGSYDVAFSYLVDSTDRNGTLRTDIHTTDRRGKYLNGDIYRLGREGWGRATQTVMADTAARRLVIDLNGYPGRAVSTPSMRVDSLVVTHYLPDSVAVDSLARDWLGYFAREFLAGRLSEPETR